MKPRQLVDRVREWLRGSRRRRMGAIGLGQQDWRGNVSAAGRARPDVDVAGDIEVEGDFGLAHAHHRGQPVLE